jgi:hypothetical protein
MSDYKEFDLEHIEGIQNTIRHTVKNEITYQIRVICYFECKYNGRSGTVDGFSNGYHSLNYEVMLQEAINQAYFNLENCSPSKFYPTKVSIIEYRPQAPYLDDSFVKDESYLEIRQKYGKKAISKSEYDIIHKLIKNEHLSKEQTAKAYKINKKYEKALKRIAYNSGAKKDYENSVKELEKAKERAKQEKKQK